MEGSCTHLGRRGVVPLLLLARVLRLLAVSALLPASRGRRHTISWVGARAVLLMRSLEVVDETHWLP